jgi:hypothetical protein
VEKSNLYKEFFRRRASASIAPLSATTEAGSGTAWMLSILKDPVTGLPLAVGATGSWRNIMRVTLLTELAYVAEAPTEVRLAWLIKNVC